MSPQEEFKHRIDVLKARGLENIHFYPGEVYNALPNDFCLEANRLLEAVEQDEGEPLKFNDSQRK